MRILGVILVALSIAIGIGSAKIFFSFAHTQLQPDIACGEQVAQSVLRDLKTEYEAECRSIQSNIETGMNTALDYSGLIGLLAISILVLGVAMVFAKQPSQGKS